MGSRKGGLEMNRKGFGAVGEGGEGKEWNQGKKSSRKKQIDM